jgi:hypothetical protein
LSFTCIPDFKDVQFMNGEVGEPVDPWHPEDTQSGPPPPSFKLCEKLRVVDV